MKDNLNFVLYGIAVIIVLIPIFMTEVMKQSIGQPGETILLSAGLVLLIIGKLLTLKKKRQETGGSKFLDMVIIIGLAVMIIWMIIKL